MNGFTILNKNHPVKGHVIEDAFGARRLARGITLIVADGVSRDPLPVLPDKTSEEGKKLWRSHYPDPSFAKEVADLATEKVSSYLGKVRSWNEKTLVNAIAHANHSLREYNRKHFPNPNFLVHDEAGCQCAAALLQRELVYAFLSSCGIALIRDGEVLLKTPDEYWSTDEQRHQFLKASGLRLFESGHGLWHEPETRFILRSFYRNAARPGGYGILTGSEQALSFVRVGRRKIKKEDVVLAYTDGLAEIIFSEPLKENSSLKEAVKDLFQRKDFSGLEEYCREHIRSEGTLTYHVVE